MTGTTTAEGGTTVCEASRSPRSDPHWFASAHGIFVVLATLLIGAVVFLTPAGWGLDEQSHVNRSYQIGQGNLLPEILDNGETYDGAILRALQEYQILGHVWSSGVDSQRPFYERRDFRDLKTHSDLAAQPLDGGNVVHVHFTNAGAPCFPSGCR